MISLRGHHDNKFNKTPIPMSISIHNTLTSKKEPFKSLLPRQVSMYCCGVTVYDLCHLGHARAAVVWDTVRRYLEWRGYEVNYVQNFTDIDDKILNRAQTEGLTMAEVSAKYIDAYFTDLARLNVRLANNYPRATEHIPQIVALVAELEKKGLAYAVAGDVYFRVRQFADYGKLSGRKLDDMQAGAGGRVAVAHEEDSIKEDSCDFALWKGAKEGEPAWDSPWGKGRPGWHIECSAMIRSTLGQTIDIHCGGNDLVFPHHENEIAQSEGAHNHPLSRYWMHNGMVNVDGEKMSKSLGNFTTIRDLLDRPIDPMVIRLFILTAQYRKPMDFTAAALTSNERSWQTLKDGLLFGQRFGEKLGWDLRKPPTLPVVTDVTATVFPSILPHVSLPTELQPVVQPFQSLPANVRQFSQEYRGLVVLTIALFFTQFPVRFFSRFLDTFNTLPVLPNFLEFVGVVVTARTVLFKAPREKFFSSLRQALNYLFKNRAVAEYSPVNESVATASEQQALVSESSFQQFCTIVDEDFNFAGGLAVLFELAKDLGKAGNILTHGGQIPDAPMLEQQWYSLQELALVLGLEAQLADEPEPVVGLDDQAIKKLIADRKAARAAKDFKKGDKIRDDLKAQGIVLVDRKGEPTTWHRS
jgi:cysteinyl-tRNA synthetase